MSMNDKAKKFLRWGGTAGAIVAAIAYIIIILVIVQGFNSQLDQQKQILISVLGAIVGITITFLLREQGITFAKELPESIRVMNEYNILINRIKPLKKLHTIKWFMFWATTKDIFIKGTTIAGSTLMVLYIFREGNGDYQLFLLALSNIVMFAGLGLWAMSKMYDIYIENHIPAIEERIKKLKTDERASIHVEEQ